MGGIMKDAAAVGMVLLVAALIPQFESRNRAEAGEAAPAPTSPRLPEAPRTQVTVDAVPARVRTIHVPAGDSLQAAINSARPGDVITLDPGAVYQGPFRLPRKDGSGWIVISSKTADRDLPNPGERVQPRHWARMPKLVSASAPVIDAAPGAHHFRLLGLEIAPLAGVYLRTLIDLGSDASQLAEVPEHIVIDRCYLRGDVRRGTRRGIALNARSVAIVDSHFADFKEVGADSQAIAGWNGPGPFRIANNYLEGAGENVMFGGADPRITDLVPSDIEIVGNVFAKPLEWKEGDPRFAGVAWTVKNLFELKNARRVLIAGNLFQYNWPHGQNGFAILFTPRNQDGDSPWSVVEDVMFRDNVVRHVAAGVNILGHDDIHRSRQTSRIAIINNVFADVGGRWGHGRLFQLLDGTRDVVIDHNTAFQTGSILFGGDHRPHAGFVFQNNIVLSGSTGISGSNTAQGPASLARYFPNAVVRRNVFVGGTRERFPDDNFFPSAIEEVGFAPVTPGEAFARVAKRYAGMGTDGRDPGAKLDTVSPIKRVEQLQQAQTVAIPSELWLDEMSSVATVVFWLSLAILGYVCVGYPVLVRVRAALRPRTRRRAPIEPTVTIIVSAHNEGDRIERRLRNLLSLDYPADRLEIILGSDGSTDDTVERARAFESAGVVVEEFTNRRGKPALLNALVPRATGEIVVFADARQRFERVALRALVANFADPGVGVVSGHLIVTATTDAEIGGEGAAMYWHYEKLIRSTESRGGSTVGATGAIYAIRKSLFESLPLDTILDDVLIPVRIARRGYQVVFEPAAKAFDIAPSTAQAELVRKVRTIGGTFQLFARERWLLNPRLNPLWFETVSHKALRLALPVLLGAVLVSNLALLDWWPYQVTMAGQAAFYAAAIAGCGHRGGRALIVKLPYTMCLLSWATVVGFFRFVTDHQHVTWDRIRSSDARSHL
ncbi:MAG TPA: glycosyltransferase family 2 protein [Vicinamibacterales bacterium]